MIIGCSVLSLTFETVLRSQGSMMHRFVVFIRGFNRGSVCILRENQVHNHSVVCFKSGFRDSFDLT